jgi:hypothetical protein
MRPDQHRRIDGDTALQVGFGLLAVVLAALAWLLLLDLFAFAR